MRLLANRTLWLWGDSFSQQLHRSMTECSFFIGSPLLETSLEDRNCCTASSCVTFYGHGARICSVRADNALFSQTNKRCLRCLQEGDIMIANIGLHFNVRGEYAKAIKMGISDLQRIMKKVSVIWRTNPPQHFDTPGGNFYKGARTAARGCKAVGGLPMMQKAEWRNSIANPFIKKAGIPIMHVWETALKFPELHPGSMGNKMDCLHWCEYSNNVLRVWNSMMLNYIAGAENLCGDKLLHTCEDIQ